MIKHKLIVLLCCAGAILSPALDCRGADVALISGSTIDSFSEAARAIQGFLVKNGTSVDFYDAASDPDFVSKVKSQGYKVICVLGTAPFKKVQAAVTDTPLVFSMVLSPAESGIVDMAGPSGKNFTGVSLDVPAKAQLELLRKVSPGIRRVGVLYTVKSDKMFVDAKLAQDDLGLEIVSQKISSSTDVPSALRSLENIDSLWIIPDPRVCTKDTLPFILNFCSDKKLPVLAFSNYLVKAGALCCYTYDYKDIGVQTAQLVVRVIRGEDPGSIAVIGPRKVGYDINAKVIKYLGLNVPASVIKGADNIIE